MFETRKVVGRAEQNSINLPSALIALTREMYDSKGISEKGIIKEKHN
jgi:hypothetical protein